MSYDRKSLLIGAVAGGIGAYLLNVLTASKTSEATPSSSYPARGVNSPGAPVASADVLQPGRVAVVIGSASGIGLCAAKNFAQLGMRVVLADIDAKDLKEAEAAVAALSPQGASYVYSSVVDCGKFEDLKRLKDEVYAKFGEVGVLMNNAAIQNNGAGGPFEFMDRWQSTLQVNLWGVINGCHAFVPAMQAQDTPCVVINTGSKQGITMPPGDTAYNVSKAGVKCYTEGLQHKLRSQPNNKVNAFLLVPGWTITMIKTRAEMRLQGKDFDPQKAEDERSYRGGDAKVASESLQKRGAWPAQKVVDTMLDAVKTGAPFYVICPDHETSKELDDLRIQWTSDDLVYRRVPLSRWSTQYGDEYKALSKGL